jgi:hypothetical protein
MVNGVEAGGTNISLANLDHVAAALNVASSTWCSRPGSRMTACAC